MAVTGIDLEMIILREVHQIEKHSVHHWETAANIYTNTLHFPNRNRPTDLENKLKVPKGDWEREG